MTQPRPTYDVFRLKPSEASYDKFVPAKSLQVEQHIDHPVEEPHATTVDTLDELRREDEAYLESLAKSRHHEALEQLEREKQEAELFRRQRAVVKRRVNVADAIRGRVHQPLIGSLSLGPMIKKRRVVNKSVAKNYDNNGSSSEHTKPDTFQNSPDTTDVHAQADLDKEVKPVELVSGYSSSSDDEEHQIVRCRDAASEGTEQKGDGDRLD